MIRYRYWQLFYCLVLLFDASAPLATLDRDIQQ